MKMSAGVEWGVHCCVVLSQASEPVPAARLAEFHGISRTYLAKHLQQLSRAGLVRSSEGRDGGYELTRTAASITVLDVVQAIDGDQPAFRCTEIRQRGPLASSPEECARPCGVARVMADAERAWRRSLRQVSVADLAATVDKDSGRTALTALRGWLADG
ncbi:MAG: RrF2 family transcriptional regulator [Marmoricola sp.]